VAEATANRKRTKRADGDTLGWRDVAGALGPGLVTGAADDDPSGIATYAQVGAQLGYSMLWTAPLALPLMATVQYMCAKIGLATGRGLAGVLKMRYPQPVVVGAVLILLVANTINLGVDIGAIAAAVNLFLPVPAPVVAVPVTALLIVLLVFGSYDLISKIFKWLTLALFAYVGAALLAKPDWGEVLKSTLIPSFSFDSNSIVALVAILGTTISPYLFFYQAEDEVQEEISAGKVTLSQRLAPTPRKQLKLARIDVFAGMLVSQVVMYFIILATAATLHASGQTNVSTAADVAKALEPLAGPLAEVLLACALIGAGMLTVPILSASSSYAVAETFGWKRGLDQKPRRAWRFYALIVAGLIAGMVIEFLGIDPIVALFWTAVLNGVAAPPILWLTFVVANDRKIMGKDINGKFTNALVLATAVLMTVAVLAWFALLATGQGSST
jgi:NRAMP (natural resistance-associated macrophage protein)-like metal ion transporter